MANTIKIINRAGQSQEVTPGKSYPSTVGGMSGSITYDNSGNPYFKPNPIAIINRAGQSQEVTPGKGYSAKVNGKRGYIVYNKSGEPTFTRYPNQQPTSTRPPVTRPPVTRPPVTRPPAAQPPASRPPAQPPASRPAPPPPTSTAPKPPESAQTGNREADLGTWARTNREMINKFGTARQKEILAATDAGRPIPKVNRLGENLNNTQSSLEVHRTMNAQITETYDAYDLVLEYLLETGHAETVNEANYIMLQMDSDMIGNIVEGMVKYLQD